MAETDKPKTTASHGGDAARHGGKPVAPYAHEGHEHSATPYVVVWIVLCGLTLLTVLTGKQHLGAVALPLALVIASTKSLLVLIFFMHLKEQKGAPRLIIGLAFSFAMLLIFFTITDVATRFVPLTPAGAPFGAKVHMPSEKERKERAHEIGIEKFPRVSPF